MGIREDREEFFAVVRQSLGRDNNNVPIPPQESRLSSSKEDVEKRVQEVKARCQQKSGELVSRLIESATKARWNVFQASSTQAALDYINALVKKYTAASLVRSDHVIFETMRLEDSLSQTGVRVLNAFLSDDSNAETRDFLRQSMISADIGITGVEYAIAETGSCVLIPRKGVSRLVSLLPPVHVALVEKAQILETPDDVFTLRRWEFMQSGDIGSYMNFITGPSRTADIEQTLTVGVHGPKEVHMLILQ